LLEQDTHPVSDFEVVALAKALKISAAWLLGEGE